LIGIALQYSLIIIILVLLWSKGYPLKYRM